jgi:4-diphosphocytidyl-2-C-methyl-D-erythritol kinase
MPHEGGASWDLVLPARAKVNFGLYVLDRRADGYHDIWTIFREIAFHDTLYFRRQSETLSISTNQADLPVGEDNLITRAVRLMQRKAGGPARLAIHLEKRIPLAAGLGGGSSNAATTLIALNRLYALGLSQADLASLGAELGADVPFFIYGGAAIVRGRGERLEPLVGCEPLWLVLINPGIHVSTGWAYKNVNLKLTNFRPIISVLSRMENIVLTGSQRMELINMLEEPVIKRYPVIESIKTTLLTHGAEWAMMSGSGSTTFGVFSSKVAAEEARQHIERPEEWLVVVTRTI